MTSHVFIRVEFKLLVSSVLSWFDSVLLMFDDIQRNSCQNLRKKYTEIKIYYDLHVWEWNLSVQRWSIWIVFLLLFACNKGNIHACVT